MIERLVVKFTESAIKFGERNILRKLFICMSYTFCLRKILSEIGTLNRTEKISNLIRMC